MIRRTLITTTILVSLSVPALAQNNITVIREAVPSNSQSSNNQAIIANSAQDMAIQEQIRQINANNARVNSQIGISDGVSYGTSANIIPATNTVYGTPASNTITNKYEGAKIELFVPPATNVSYANTVSSIPASTTRKSVATYTRIHRVIKGDNLFQLARKNCVTVEDIKNNNGLNSNAISIGQALAMPASQCGATLTPRASTTTRSESGTVRQVMPIQTGIKVRSGNAYAVLPKDSLYSIGKRYCLSATELAEFNSIDTVTPIQPGQILRLPSTTCN